MRWHAEGAALDLAVRCGDTSTARQCCRHVLAFLEMALGHCPWHPALALERYQVRVFAHIDLIYPLTCLPPCMFNSP